MQKHFYLAPKIEGEGSFPRLTFFWDISYVVQRLLRLANSQVFLCKKN